jgi:hypothetical protein
VTLRLPEGYLDEARRRFGSRPQEARELGVAAGLDP